MKRLLIGAVSAAALAAFSLPAASSAIAVGQSGYGHPYCEQGAATCTELNQYTGSYTGHDEPSLLFYSNTAGSRNNATYRMTLPTDPPALPRQNGSGGALHLPPPPPLWVRVALSRHPPPPHPGGSPARAPPAPPPAP